MLVPTERHVEALAGASEPAHTLRKVVRELAAEESPELAPTTPETTRLLAARLASVPVAHAVAVDNALGRLRRAGARPEMLANAGERGRHFAELLSRANQTLAERQLRDDREAPWLAARRLDAELDSGARFGSSTRVRGLTRWDPCTLAFLEALHRTARKRGGQGLCLELPELDVTPLSNASDALASELEARWAGLNDPPEFVLVPSQALGAERLSLVEAHDAGSEARAVARVVLEAIERGTPLDRIAIVPVDLAEAFLEPLRFELMRASIPFAEPRGRPAIAAPRAHAALELLRLARGPLGRDALVDVLRVPGLTLDRWFNVGRGGLGELLHELDSLPLRIERAPGELLAELGDRLAQLRADDSAQATRLGALRDGLASFLVELAALGQLGARSEHAARAAALFAELSLFEPSARTLRFALSRATRGASELLMGLGHDAVAARAVETAFERSTSAAAALGVEGDRIPLADWLDEVELALEGVAPTRGAARAAAVRVARPDDVAAMDLSLVVLCRASDMSLDRAAPAESTLGSELEASLPSAARPVSAGLEQHFSALSVASALSRAERVVVTWALHDESTSLSPSRLARSLARRASPRREPASPLSAAARRAVPVTPASATASARVSIERAHIGFYASPSAPLDANNGDAGSLDAFFGGEPVRPLAVTALERAIRCPFLAFSGNVLRATRDDPMGDAIGYRERGSLLHEALAAALEATRGAWGTSPNEALVERGTEAARELLERRGRSALRRAGLANTLADVRAMLLWVFSHQDGLVFRYAERGFGEQAEWGPLELGPWQVSGRVDRIDVNADGRRVRVIDYKTRAPRKVDDLTLLQPWLYARKVGLELGAEEVEFCFLSFDKRNPTLRQVYDGPVDGEAISAALERAQTTLIGLRTGRVPARPGSSSSCARCDARDVCRRPLSAPESSEE